SPATPTDFSPLLNLAPRNEPCYTKGKAVAHAGLWLARLMFHNSSSRTGP
ncbi:Os09g0243450, partial [Oryza sativa Japonica Group]